MSDGERVGSSARGGAHGRDMSCRASPWRKSPHLTGRSCRGWWRCRSLTKTDDLHVGRLSRRTSASRARSDPSTLGRPPPCWHNPMSSASARCPEHVTHKDYFLFGQPCVGSSRDPRSHCRRRRRHLSSSGCVQYMLPSSSSQGVKVQTLGIVASFLQACCVLRLASGRSRAVCPSHFRRVPSSRLRHLCWEQGGLGNAWSVGTRRVGRHVCLG